MGYIQLRIRSTHTLGTAWHKYNALVTSQSAPGKESTCVCRCKLGIHCTYHIVFICSLQVCASLRDLTKHWCCCEGLVRYMLRLPTKHSCGLLKMRTPPPLMLSREERSNSCSWLFRATTRLYSTAWEQVAQNNDWFMCLKTLLFIPQSLLQKPVHWTHIVLDNVQSVWYHWGVLSSAGYGDREMSVLSNHQSSRVPVSPEL